MNTGYEIKTGFYSTEGVEDTTAFNFNIGMSLASRATLINTVAELLVNKEQKTYNSILKDYIFMFYVIYFMTDIDYSFVFDKDQSDKDYFVNQIERILSTTNVYQIVAANNEALINQLYKSLNDTLAYKTGVREDLNNVIISIQKLVDTVFKKVEGIDVDVISSAATALSNITGDVTAEKIIDAIQKSDDYTSTEEIIESKNAEIRELKGKLKDTESDE